MIAQVLTPSRQSRTWHRNLTRRSKGKETSLGEGSEKPKSLLDQCVHMVAIAIAADIFSFGSSTPVADDTPGCQTRQPRQLRSGCGRADQATGQQASSPLAAVKPYECESDIAQDTPESGLGTDRGGEKDGKVSINAHIRQ